MDDAASLLEIESIKQVKARYCRFLDTKDWEAWRSLFSDGFHSDTSQAGGKVIVGADDFVAVSWDELTELLAGTELVLTDAEVEELNTAWTEA